MLRQDTIGNKTIQNRVLLQPMEGADGTRNGGISDLTRRRYLRFAESGVGIIWFEAVAVTHEGRANPHQLFLNEENKGEFKSLLDEMRDVSTQKFGFAPIIICQLTHSGRQSRPDDDFAPIVAYRSCYLEQGKENLHYTVATDTYLDTIPAMYKESTLLAREVGFDGVDVKCCHGYLFVEMLSAYQREGKYGGSFENRSRLFFDSLDATLSVAGDMIVSSRLNASDCYIHPNGYGVDSQNRVDLTECKMLLDILAKKGVELVNITLGNPYFIPHVNRPWIHAPESIEAGLTRVEDIMKELSQDSPVKLVMSALTALKDKCLDYGQEMLDKGYCDYIGYGRQAFAYPTFFADYQKYGKIEKNKCCIMCGNCTKLMRARTVTGCPVRDREVYLPIYNKAVEGK